MQDLKIDVCGGCNAKLGSVQLNEILQQLPSTTPHPLLITDYQTNDDACVFKLPSQMADLNVDRKTCDNHILDSKTNITVKTIDNSQLVLLQTVDFFPAPVAEPYYFGQIAAANALSDIYAMGGQPAFALNIVGFPADHNPEILREILAGGQSKIEEAGASIAGGHSIHDHQAKYGLCVTGFVPLDQVKHNNHISKNCRLFLSKPLGTGVLCAAAPHGLVNSDEYASLIAGMTQLNKTAAELALKYDVIAMTDVTGFGFIGHLCEMLGYLHSASSDNTENSDSDTPNQLQHRAEIYGRKIPFYAGAERLAADMLHTGGGARNRKAFAKYCSFRHQSDTRQTLLFDPQTSGGLLIALDENHPQLDQFLVEADKLSIIEIGRIYSEPGKIEIL